jgi:hypothetical protein
MVEIVSWALCGRKFAKMTIPWHIPVLDHFDKEIILTGILCFLLQSLMSSRACLPRIKMFQKLHTGAPVKKIKRSDFLN